MAMEETRTWPDLAIGLYEHLTGRGSEIAYTLDQMEIMVPSKVGEGADHARWVLNGTLRITTKDNANGS